MTTKAKLTDREVPRVRSNRGNISDRVRQIIDTEHNGNVAEAARLLRISQRGLQKVYRGITKSPRPNVLVRISDVYNVELGWLLTGMERSTPDAIEKQVIRKALKIVRQVTESITADAVKTDGTVRPRRPAVFPLDTWTPSRRANVR